MNLTPTNYIIINDSSVQVNAKNPAEAAIALKELKIKKKEYGIIKRNLNAQKREIRSSFNHQTAQRGPKFMGGGGLGRLIRGIQTISRANARAEVSNQIAPLEVQSQEIDSIILAIDSAIVQLEAYLMKYA